MAPLAAQSSHLTRLETTAPAVMPDLVGGIAMPGWAGAWHAPAVGTQVEGLVFGVEHAGFAAVTTVAAAGRFSLGPLWQVSVAQLQVRDLFDDALLETYPELAELRATASAVALDAVLGAGRAVTASLGFRHERDEFLGDRASAIVLRASVAGPAIGTIRPVVAVERVAGSSVELVPGGIRVRGGLAGHFKLRQVRVSLGAGYMTDQAWAAVSTRSAATVAGLTLADLVTLTFALGLERHSAEGGWLGTSAASIGIAVAPVGVTLRYGGMGSREASPTAFSLSYSTGRP